MPVRQCHLICILERRESPAEPFGEGVGELLSFFGDSASNSGPWLQMISNLALVSS